MKKLWILSLALLLLVLSCAHAEAPCEMKVVNCSEWVSLRAAPDSDARRFAKVPLGAVVQGFYGSNGDFSQCSYAGMTGYILTDYLQVTSKGNDNHSLPQEIADREISLADGCVRIWRDYMNDGEIMYVGRYDGQNRLLWSTSTRTLAIGQLDGTEAFINDRAVRPALMLYNCDFGLTALDIDTGEEIWVLPSSEVSLGGCIVHAVAEDGTMYIGGYYGPDPVAISAEGRVLWQAVQNDTDFYWMYEIMLASDGIIVRYENGDAPVIAKFDMEGRLIAYQYVN